MPRHSYKNQRLAHVTLIAAHPCQEGQLMTAHTIDPFMSALELAAAIRAASDAGASGVSFYRGTTATPAERAVIRSHPWPPTG